MPTLNRTSSGGVRDLLARFENSEPTTPPPQRTSPGGSATKFSEGPLAKVRTSFVSVEPSGNVGKDLGLPKETTDGMGSTAAERSEGFSLNRDQDGGAILELKRSITQEGDERERSADVVEAVPEHAIEPTPAPSPPSRAPKDKNTSAEIDHLGGKVKGMTLPDEDAPMQNPDKPGSAEEDDEASMRPSDPKDEEAVSGGAALPPPAEALSPLTNIVDQFSDQPKANGESRELPATNGEAAELPNTNGEAAGSPGAEGDAHEMNGEAPKHAAKDTTGQAPAETSPTAANSSHVSAARSPMVKKTPSKASQTPNRPTPVSTAKENSAKVTPKAAKTPKSPATALKTPTSASAATPARAASASKPSPFRPASSRTSLTASKEPAKAPPARTPRTSTTGRLSLTAPTASSAAKASPKSEAPKPADAAAPKPSAQPSSKTKPRPKSPTRPLALPSHLTAPTASSAAKHDPPPANGTMTSLSRKPSTLTRDRAAKPSTNGAAQAASSGSGSGSGSARPSLSAPKRPESRAGQARAHAAPPDGGFLARMTRPTASSAGKAHDKAEARSPPPVRRAASVRAKLGPGAAGGGLSRGGSVLRRKGGEGGKGVPEARENGSAGGEKGERATGQANGEGEGEGTLLRDGDGGSAGMAQTPEFDGAVIR